MECSPLQIIYHLSLFSEEEYLLRLSCSNRQFCLHMHIQVRPYKVIVPIGPNHMPHRLHGRISSSSPVMDRRGKVGKTGVDRKEDQLGLCPCQCAEAALMVQLCHRRR